jgi:hypothetical protein
MNESENTRIATAWLDFQRNWWAYDKLDELCSSEPETAIAVLQAMIAQAGSKELLEDIGVGPLEDFVNNHASSHIDQIESLAGSNEAFSAALAHAQVRDGEHPMAGRLSALGCRIAGKLS